MSRTCPTLAYALAAVLVTGGALGCGAAEPPPPGAVHHRAQALSAAALSASLSAAPAQARVDQPVTFTMTLQNSGAGSAHDIRVTLALPPDAAVIAAPSGAGWHCTLKADSYACTRAELPASAQAQLRFQLAATCDSPEKLAATVQVASDATTADAGALSAAASAGVDRTEVSGGGFACSVGAPGGRAPGGGAGAGQAGLAGLWGLLVAGVARRRRALAKVRG